MHIKSKVMKKIIVIGNGISGITCARYIRKRSNYSITVVSSETDHFFSRTALMYIYMGHMKYEHTKPYEDWFWKKNRIDLVKAKVEEVNTGDKQVRLSNGKTMQYDKLVIATGSKSNKFGWPGQDADGVQVMYSYQDIERMEKYTKDIDHAVVVGGGLIGIEMVEMLLSRNIGVTFLIREKSYWNMVLPPEESTMVNRLIRKHHVDLRLGTELKEILTDNTGRARAVLTNKGEEILCQFVGLTVGVHPNIEFLKESGIELERGVVVNDFLETNVEDVYAIGDCAQHNQPKSGRRPIEQVWYTGRIMGETLANTITGNQTAYEPGLWFNSAKFFDLEYQTYGWVWVVPKGNEDQFYWEHESGEMCLRFVFDKNQRNLLGINTFGIRLRQDVCHKWIKEKTSIDKVISQLKMANFDPEFFKRYEKEISLAFQEEGFKKNK